LRERGINKIYAYSTTTGNFSISIVATLNSSVYPNTASIVSDKIIFLSTDGLYSFDGLNAKKIYTQIDDIFAIDNTSASAVSEDNKYYLCARLAGSSEDKNALIVIDFSLDDVSYFCNDENYVLAFSCVYNGERNVGFLINSQNSKNAKLPLILCKSTIKTADCQDFLYLSNSISLEPVAEKKVLQTLYIKANGNANIEIFDEKNCKKFSVKPSEFYQKFNLNFVCEDFSIKLCGKGQIVVDQIKIGYCYCG
jgi:hypothetical protein